MKMEWNEEEITVYPQGRLDLSTATDFNDILTSLTDRHIKRICLDFSSVSDIDSPGLGKLLVSQKKLRELGRELYLRNVDSERVRKVFSLVHLHKAINIKRD